jgi:hypothetical protein
MRDDLLFGSAFLVSRFRMVEAITIISGSE